MIRFSSHLPILAALPELLDALGTHACAVLQAPPGAGKSTGVPLALLDAPWLSGKILMLEPRRLAARSVAMRMASTLHEPVGRTVGYRTRLDTKISAQTRIEVVTEGILTRMLQQDAALEGIGIVIFDEFHERSLQADLGLALCLDVQGTLREDLKLLAMSATLDGAAVAHLLGDAPIVTSAGQAFPVTTHYRHTAVRKIWNDTDLARDVVQVLLRVLESDAGDVLVFLPGQGEIRRAQRLLEETNLPQGTRVYPLYGELLAADQDLAIAPSRSGERKVVLATNIAETSLTIEGVRVVIDSGVARRARFDPVTGMSSLDTVRIARASADQRRGRAGRTQPGVCYRLWLESEHDALPAHTPPEIVEADLAPLALELAAWGVRDPNRLCWLDAPPATTFAQARELLRWLGAIDDDGLITAHGREMARLGTHPRLAHMLLKARDAGWAALAAQLAALLGERDLLRSRGHERDVDMRTRIEALHGQAPRGMEVDSGTRQRALRAAEHFLRQMNAARDLSAHDIDHVGRVLALAYPDRIARARGAGGRYLLANGRGAALSHPQLLSNAAFLVVAALDAAERDARIQLAAPVSLAELEVDFAARIETRDRIEWDAREQAVIAQRERKLGALTLDAQRLEQPDHAQWLSALLQGIRSLGLECLAWTPAAQALRQRLRFARQHDMRAPQPWPDVDDAALLAQLESWLAPWLEGITRRAQLAQVNVHDALLARLDWNQQQRLNDIAPTHLSVPSGSHIAVDYSGDAPTLSVRLQEVFGWRDTPRVGGVPVVMELLSPARRPVQVTQDLASFWSRGYHDVKKDLKGRYPKHYWPDDPLQAQATARAKPRLT